MHLDYFALLIKQHLLKILQQSHVFFAVILSFWIILVDGVSILIYLNWLTPKISEPLLLNLILEKSSELVLYFLNSSLHA